MEGQLAELKETEARITVATQQKDDAQAARFKGLVTMYENMKPRDAAKIFDRLDIDVLLEVASKIEPRKMADILAQMSPDTAAAPDRRARQPGAGSEAGQRPERPAENPRPADAVILHPPPRLVRRSATREGGSGGGGPPCEAGWWRGRLTSTLRCRRRFP